MNVNFLDRPLEVSATNSEPSRSCHVPSRICISAQILKLWGLWGIQKGLSIWFHLNSS